MTASHWSVLSADPAVPTRFDSALYFWLANRAGTVEPRTFRTDQELLRLIPPAYLTRELSTIGPCELAEILAGLHGLGEPAVRRRRASLSAFFAWCARVGLQVKTAAQPAPEPAVAASRSRGC